MKKYALWNLDKGSVIAANITHPTGWYGRALGLLTRKGLDADKGLWLDRCHAVHTVGMKFPIDVVFLDEAFCVLCIRSSVRAGCLVITESAAHHVVELPAGTCTAAGLHSGERMAIV